MVRVAIALVVLLGATLGASAQGRGALAIEVAGAGGQKQWHQLYSASYALVIGIDKYTEKGWPPLRNAVADAEKVASALTEQGFDVMLRKDLNSSELFPTLLQFFIDKGHDPDARLFLWYAGHGHTMTSPSEEGYLVPADAPSAETDTGFRLKAVAMSQFAYLMTQAKAKHVLAVFDSCFSGTALDISRDHEMLVPPEINLQTGGRARQMISAGDRNQRVSDNGTFRQVFLDAILGKVPGVGRNGYVTAQEIGAYLRREMPLLTVQTATPQTPNTGYLNRAGYNHGNFVFRFPEPTITVLTRPASPAMSSETCIEVPIGEIPHVSSRAIASPKYERRCLKPKESFKDCRECPEMTIVPVGRFTMGSPVEETERDQGETQVAITMTTRVAVSKFAVTRGEFERFVEATAHKTEGPCWTYDGSKWGPRDDRNWLSPGFDQTDRHPIVCINWQDAKAYTQWLVFRTGHEYRLAAEAEREYITRAGTDTPFWWGSSITPAQAKYFSAESADSGEWRSGTVRVDSFAANPWGFHNVHGNVWDWTEDCWNPSNSGNTGNGSARVGGDCNYRVIRGGSWVTPFAPRIA